MRWENTHEISSHLLKVINYRHGGAFLGDDVDPGAWTSQGHHSSLLRPFGMRIWCQGQFQASEYSISYANTCVHVLYPCNYTNVFPLTFAYAHYYISGSSNRSENPFTAISGYSWEKRLKEKCQNNRRRDFTEKWRFSLLLFCLLCLWKFLVKVKMN